MTAGSQPPTQEAPAAGYSLQDAAATLGISINTLRRKIAAGQVKGERVQRPQGYVWRVYLDDRYPPIQEAPDPPVQEAPDPPVQEAPSRLQQPPTAMMQAEAMAAYTRSILEPLVALVADHEATIREQAETIGRQGVELERAASTLMGVVGERDVARAEVEELRAAEAARAAQPEPEAPPLAPTTSSAQSALLRRFWPLIAAVVALVAAWWLR